MGDDERPGAQRPLQRRVLVLGDAAALGQAVASRLERVGWTARTRNPANDAEAKALLDEGWDAAAIVTRDDALALRLTLLCAHVHPDLPLWATLFDRTTVHQLRQSAPRVHVLSPAELAAAALTDACLAAGARALPRWRAGVRLVDDALRMVAAAGAALVAVLIVQIIISLIGLHENGVNAIFFSMQELATVAGSPHATSAPAWFKLISTIDTALAVGLLAVFTAGLVRIASRQRLTTALGRRAVPRRGHVIVVGFGQVGMRLMQSLRARGVPVVAVERNVDAPQVRLAPRAKLPLAIARGDDRSTLELLGVRRCAVVAAVTSDDLSNVAVGLAVHDVTDDRALVLRLGDGDVASETDSLLHLGTICDIHEVVAGRLVDEIAAIERRVLGARADG